MLQGLILFLSHLGITQSNERHSFCSNLLCFPCDLRILDASLSHLTPFCLDTWSIDHSTITWR